MRRLRTLMLLPCALMALVPLSAVALPALPALPYGGLADLSPEVTERDWRADPDNPDYRVAQGCSMSLDQAVEQVKRKYRNGRIINAETRGSGDREVYHIKVLTEDGRVRTERIPRCRPNSRS